MTPRPLRVLAIALLVLVALVLALAAFVWSGVYDIGADTGHARPVRAVLETLRERSIARHADDVQAPALDDPERIRRGAGNYDAMCRQCHLAPGQDETELARGLNPAPPAFARAHDREPAHDFWVAKHGIKASGMPAWGLSMDDAAIWDMVAFLQRLPDLDAAAYDALVASSDGHSHGGGAVAPSATGAADAASHDPPPEESHPHADDGHAH